MNIRNQISIVGCIVIGLTLVLNANTISKTDNTLDKDIAYLKTHKVEKSVLNKSKKVKKDEVKSIPPLPKPKPRLPFEVRYPDQKPKHYRVNHQKYIEDYPMSKEREESTTMINVDDYGSANQNDFKMRYSAPLTKEDNIDMSQFFDAPDEYDTKILEKSSHIDRFEELEKNKTLKFVAVVPYTFVMQTPHPEAIRIAEITRGTILTLKNCNTAGWCETRDIIGYLGYVDGKKFKVYHK